MLNIRGNISLLVLLPPAVPPVPFMTDDTFSASPRVPPTFQLISIFCQLPGSLTAVAPANSFTVSDHFIDASAQ
jgi:hypothetical protein